MAEPLRLEIEEVRTRERDETGHTKIARAANQADVGW
jgi:hypothetical protein